MIPSWKGTSRQLYDEMRTIDKAAKCVGLGLPRLPDDCWAQKLRLANVNVRGGYRLVPEALRKVAYRTLIQRGFKRGASTRA